MSMKIITNAQQKELFEQAKEIQQLGKSAKVVYRKFVISSLNNAT